MLLRVPRAISVWFGTGTVDTSASKLTPHNEVTTTLSYLNKAMLFENPANFTRGEDAQLRHEPVPVS